MIIRSMKKDKKLWVVGLFFLLTLNVFPKNLTTENDFFYREMLFQWTENATHESKAEVLDLFKGLPDKVEGFLEIKIIDLSMSSEGFDTLLILKFSSREVEKIYTEHPDHKKIQEIAPPLVSKFGMFEYTSPN